MRVDPTDGPLAAFAHRLRDQRLSLGLSMDDVARRAGCSASVLGEYERAVRAPRDEQFVRDLAEVLGIPAEALVTDWSKARTQPSVPYRDEALSPSHQPATRARQLRAVAMAFATAIGAGVAILVFTLGGGTDAEHIQEADLVQGADPGQDGHADTRAGVSITVAPRSDLSEGQRVRVVGAGFSPGQVNVIECRNGGPPACDFGADHDGQAGGQVFWTADANGAFSVTVAAQSSFTGYDVPGGSPIPVDCTTGAGCIMVASQGPQAFATAPISFRSGVRTLRPSITVTATSGLKDLDLVTVTGSGYTASGEDVWVGECAATLSDPVVCDHESAHHVFVPVDANGGFSASITVHEKFMGRRDGDPTIIPVDCRVAPGCIISAGQSNPNISAFQRISFG